MQNLKHRHTTIALVLFGLLFGLLVSAIIVTANRATATAAQEPTRAPVPTFTPTPMQADYTRLATQHQQALAAGMSTVGTLLSAPRLSDPTWTGDVETAMRAVEAAYGSLVALQPPPVWANFHAAMTSGAADCGAAMRVLALTLDEQDRNAVPVVGKLLQRCQSQLAAAQQFVADARATATAP